MKETKAADVGEVLAVVDGFAQGCGYVELLTKFETLAAEFAAVLDAGDIHRAEQLVPESNFSATGHNGRHEIHLPILHRRCSSSQKYSRMPTGYFESLDPIASGLCDKSASTACHAAAIPQALLRSAILQAVAAYTMQIPN